MSNKSVPHGAPSRPNTKLAKFVAAIGSRQGADPIPPSQYLFFLDPAMPAVQRLVAWVRSKTIRFRRQADGTDGRSPHCIDEDGKILSLVDMARELGLKLPNASRAWSQAEELGLVRRDGKRLMLVGEVPKLTEAKTRGNVICTGNVSLSVRRAMETWPKARQMAFMSEWEAANRLGTVLQAKAVAEARKSITAVQDTILLNYGLAPNHRPPKKELPRLVVPSPLEKHVQITSAGHVQITSARHVQITKPVGVQITPSLLIQRSTSEGDFEASSSLEVSSLAAELHIDDDAALKLFSECRQHNASITVLEICVLAGYKLRQMRAKTTNPVGLLLTSIPKMVTGSTYERAKHDATIEAARRIREREGLAEYEATLAPEALPGEPAPDSGTSRR